MGSVTPLDDRAAGALALRLAGHLRASGALTEPCWQSALCEVPRHLFAPRAAYFTASDPSAPCGRFSVDEAPEVYLDAIYSDTSVILQADDGVGDPTCGTGLFSSSLSAPSVVFPFLELLDPHQGQRVLEIGTGSGYTAALLSWAIGSEAVTSVEVDGQISARAAINLKAAGYRPQLVVADGTEGWPGNAPYDRVHVTVGVTQIPPAWIEQTRPGGVLVMPWHPNGMHGHRLRLTALGPETAVGELHGGASYMMLRSQRFNTRWRSHNHEDAEHSTTRMHPRAIAEAGPGAELMFAALAPGIGFRDVSDDGDYSLLLYELKDRDGTGSWAACDVVPGSDEFQVVEYGDRRLWRELESAYLQWDSLGRPACDRFGVKVDPGGVRLWLDAGASSWRIPAPGGCV